MTIMPEQFPEPYAGGYTVPLDVAFDIGMGSYEQRQVIQNIDLMQMADHAAPASRPVADCLPGMVGCDPRSCWHFENVYPPCACVCHTEGDCLDFVMKFWDVRTAADIERMMSEARVEPDGETVDVNGRQVPVEYKFSRRFSQRWLIHSGYKEAGDLVSCQTDCGYTWHTRDGQRFWRTWD